MKAPVDWIRELVPELKSSPKRLSDLLTFSGTEVEAITKDIVGPVLTCAVTSNRPDCLGVMGLARDLATVARKPFLAPPCDVEMSSPDSASRVSIAIHDTNFCPRYVGVVVEGIRVGPSPDWLRTRVEAMGARSINNVVDITNYILFERCQPLHAFDLDKVVGSSIVVRRASKGEKILALDGRTYALDPSMGVIADSDGPVAIAGVMGGERTSVSDRTTRVLIESACFDAPSVRRASRALALRSDSSYRFERGVDAEGAMLGALRAARLLVAIAGGTVRSSPLDLRTAPRLLPTLSLSRQRIKSVTGTSITASRVKQVLSDLGCDVTVSAASAFAVRPPSWRADLTREIDLIEEVIRVVGLDKIPDGNGLRVIPVKLHPERMLIDGVKTRLALLGLDECVTPTFVREGADADVAFLASGSGLKVRNPVRQGEGAVRRSLLPSLLDVRSHNQDQGNSDLRLFEVANLSYDQGGAVPERIPAVAALLDGTLRAAKGTLDALADGLGVVITYGPSLASALDPSMRQSVLLSGVPIGVIGRVDRELAMEHRLELAPLFFELDLRALVGAWRPVKTFMGLPKFPASVRDLAFILPEGVPYASLNTTLKAAGGADLESVCFFDEFRGPQIGVGMKSLAVSVIFRSASGTLAGPAVDAACAAMVGAVASALGGRLR